MLNNGSIKNRTIFCHDNLEILKGIDSDCVDLIYLDPPFNKKKTFTAPIGSNAEGASFSDIFREEDVKDEWLQDIKEDHYAVHDILTAVRTIEGRTSYNFCYLAYMAIRLIECHRILKDTGSIYLHCDPTMSHHLKLLLDCIFGAKNFRNEIIWHYRRFSRNIKNAFPSMHDSLLFYAKGTDNFFNKLSDPDIKNERAYHKRGYHKDKDKLIFYTTDKQIADKIIKKHGLDLSKFSKVSYIEASRPYLHNVFLLPIINPMAKERTGYPTQKPLALLERIIAASCPEGGIVLDPFCGCATTCVAAEKLGRRWVGVDVSIKAYELVKERMKKEVERKDELFQEKVDFQTDPPVRTDMGADTRPQKYVYIISNKQYKDYFKVGIASDANRRLNSYQTSDPKRGYVLEYKFLTPNFRAIETYIHDLYKSPHEWVFEPDMQKIIKEIEGWAKD